MSEIKKLFKFFLPKEEDVDEVTKSVDDKGEEISITKKVKKAVNYYFFLKKPIRSLREQADLFYGSKLGEGIKAGLLTDALIEKHYNNNGGSLSDNDVQKYKEGYTKLFELRKQYDELKDKENPPEEDKNKIKEIESEVIKVRQDVQKLETAQINLYKNTADTRARDKTILWWILHLSYKIENDKELPFFGDGNYEQKLNNYDLLEEENEPFKTLAMYHFLFYTSIWYSGRASTQEEFENFKFDSAILGV